MRKLIKILIAAFVAVMAVAVTSAVAFAATNTYIYMPGSDINTNNMFVPNASPVATNLLTSTDVEDVVSINDDGTTNTGVISVAKAVKWNSSGTVTFSTSGVSEVTVYFANKADATNVCYVQLDSFTTSEAGSGTELVKYVVSNVGSGSHTLSRPSGSEGRLYYIKVVSEVSDSAVTYTLSGDVEGLSAGDKFTIGDYEAVVGDDGLTYTIELTEESDPFADLGTVTAYYNDEYTVSYENGGNGVSFTKETESVYKAATKIIFQEVSLGELATGTYTSWARPNFDLTAASGSSGEKYAKGSTLSFITSGPAVIDFTIKNGSSTTGNTVSYSLKNDNNVIAKSSLLDAQATGTEKFFVPKAGTYTFEVDSTSKTTAYFNGFTISYVNSVDTTNGTVVSDGTDYYVVAKVTADELSGKKSLTLGGVETSVVYASATINETEYANDNGYVFAVKVPENVVTATNYSDNILNFVYSLEDDE